jgi:GNAT superfamily N-acetyltransferase
MALVHELADYEHAAAHVRAVPADLERALFGNDPRAFAHVAECGGQVVAMAVWFLTFSTWTGRHGIWVEDLVVRRDRRGRGYGRALLAELARIARASGYTRLEWAVLDWNHPAIGFYRHLGSESLDGWTVHRVSGAALAELAGPEGGR